MVNFSRHNSEHGNLDSILSTSTQDAEKLYTACSLPLTLRLCRVGKLEEIRTPFDSIIELDLIPEKLHL